MEDETVIREKAFELGIKWDFDSPSIESDKEETINEFLSFVASWYTANRLTMVSNYDLLVKDCGSGRFELEPIPRPATLRYIPSNSSNIKPRDTKEIKPEDLPDYLKKELEIVRSTGTGGYPPETFKSSKIYPNKRYLEFTVIPKSGKKGMCFGCSREDFLMETKKTQYPLTVGLEKYANFYSYHTGSVGFCRTCAISNYLAFGRVLYNVSDGTIFMAVPQAGTIQEIVKFLRIITDSYPVIEFIRGMKHIDDAIPLLTDGGKGAWTNFVEKRFRNSGFYFLILVLFASLINSIKTLVHSIQDDQMKLKLENSEIMRLLFPEEVPKHDEAILNVSGIVFRSWEFMLARNDQHIRYWRFQNSRQIVDIFDSLNEKCHISNAISILQKLVYMSGKNYIDTWREDFSRSLLLGKPDIGILEKAVWEKISSGSNVERGLADLATCLARNVLEGSEMEKDEILKQCSNIGRIIAELSAEESSKGMLYELRSVGNAQALRTFIERFTFTCAMKGKQTFITNDFVSRLFEGDDWKVYKSIIAIIANQRYSYLTMTKEEAA